MPVRVRSEPDCVREREREGGPDSETLSASSPYRFFSPQSLRISNFPDFDQLFIFLPL